MATYAIPHCKLVHITKLHIYIYIYIYIYLFRLKLYTKMGKTPVQVCKFIQEMKRIYVLAKLLGLAQFSIKIDRDTIEGVNSYSKTNQMHNISNVFYFGTTHYMFRTVTPSIIRSLRLYIQHQVYVIQVLWQRNISVTSSLQLAVNLG